MSPRNFFHKVLSAALAGVLLFTGVVPPAAARPDPVRKTSAPFTRLSPADFAVPAALGSPAGRWESPVPSGPDVIHVQDAHGLAAAQRNLRDLLLLWAEDQPLLVAAEGAWGTVETSWLAPLVERRAAAVEYLMDAGLMTGEEAAAALRPDRIRVVGAENPALFAAHTKARALVEKRRAALNRRLAALENRLATLKARAFNFEEVSLDGDIAAYHAGKVSLRDYLSRLTGTTALNPREYPQLRAVQEAMDAEKTAGALDRELKTLLSLPQTAGREDWIGAARDVKSGRQTSAPLLNALVAEAARQGLAVPALAARARFESARENLDGEAFALELTRLEESTWDRLTKNRPDAARLARAGADLWREKNFWNEALSPRAWEDYRRRNIFLLQGEDVAPLRLAQEAYFGLAFRRDRTLADGALAAARENGAARVVLVAGGFHTDGICAALREKRISHRVVRPQITRPAGEKSAPHWGDAAVLLRPTREDAPSTREFRAALRRAYGKVDLSSPEPLPGERLTVPGVFRRRGKDLPFRLIWGAPGAAPDTVRIADFSDALRRRTSGSPDSPALPALAAVLKAAETGAGRPLSALEISPALSAGMIAVGDLAQRLTALMNVFPAWAFPLLPLAFLSPAGAAGNALAAAPFLFVLPPADGETQYSARQEKTLNKLETVGRRRWEKIKTHLRAWPELRGLSSDLVVDLYSALNRPRKFFLWTEEPAERDRLPLFRLPGTARRLVSWNLFQELEMRSSAGGMKYLLWSVLADDPALKNQDARIERLINRILYGSTSAARVDYVAVTLFMRSHQEKIESGRAPVSRVDPSERDRNFQEEMKRRHLKTLIDGVNARKGLMDDILNGVPRDFQMKIENEFGFPSIWKITFHSRGDLSVSRDTPYLPRELWRAIIDFNRLAALMRTMDKWEKTRGARSGVLETWGWPRRANLKDPANPRIQISWSENKGLSAVPLDRLTRSESHLLKTARMLLEVRREKAPGPKPRQEGIGEPRLVILLASQALFFAAAWFALPLLKDFLPQLALAAPWERLIVALSAAGIFSLPLVMILNRMIDWLPRFAREKPRFAEDYPFLWAWTEQDAYSPFMVEWAMDAYHAIGRDIAAYPAVYAARCDPKRLLKEQLREDNFLLKQILEVERESPVLLPLLRADARYDDAFRRAHIVARLGAFFNAPNDGKYIGEWLETLSDHFSRPAGEEEPPLYLRETKERVTRDLLLSLHFHRAELETFSRKDASWGDRTMAFLRRLGMSASKLPSGKARRDSFDLIWSTGRAGEAVAVTEELRALLSREDSLEMIAAMEAENPGPREIRSAGDRRLMEVRDVPSRGEFIFSRFRYYLRMAQGEKREGDPVISPSAAVAAAYDTLLYMEAVSRRDDIRLSRGLTEHRMSRRLTRDFARLILDSERRRGEIRRLFNAAVVTGGRAAAREIEDFLVHSKKILSAPTAPEPAEIEALHARTQALSDSLRKVNPLALRRTLDHGDDLKETDVQNTLMTVMMSLEFAVEVPSTWKAMKDMMLPVQDRLENIAQSLNLLDEKQITVFRDGEGIPYVALPRTADARVPVPREVPNDAALVYVEKMLEHPFAQPYQFDAASLILKAQGWEGLDAAALENLIQERLLRDADALIKIGVEKDPVNTATSLSDYLLPKAAILTAAQADPHAAVKGNPLGFTRKEFSLIMELLILIELRHRKVLLFSGEGKGCVAAWLKTPPPGEGTPPPAAKAPAKPRWNPLSLLRRSTPIILLSAAAVFSALTPREGPTSSAYARPVPGFVQGAVQTEKKVVHDEKDVELARFLLSAKGMSAADRATRLATMALGQLRGHPMVFESIAPFLARNSPGLLEALIADHEGGLRGRELASVFASAVTMLRLAEAVDRLPAGHSALPVYRAALTERLESAPVDEESATAVLAALPSGPVRTALAEQMLKALPDPQDKALVAWAVWGDPGVLPALRTALAPFTEDALRSLDTLPPPTFWRRWGEKWGFLTPVPVAPAWKPTSLAAMAWVIHEDPRMKDRVIPALKDKGEARLLAELALYAPARSPLREAAARAAMETARENPETAHVVLSHLCMALGAEDPLIKKALDAHLEDLALEGDIQSNLEALRKTIIGMGLQEEIDLPGLQTLFYMRAASWEKGEAPGTLILREPFLADVRRAARRAAAEALLRKNAVEALPGAVFQDLYTNPLLSEEQQIWGVIQMLEHPDYEKIMDEQPVTQILDDEGVNNPARAMALYRRLAPMRLPVLSAAPFFRWMRQWKPLMDHMEPQDQNEFLHRNLEWMTDRWESVRWDAPLAGPDRSLIVYAENSAADRVEDLFNRGGDGPLMERVPPLDPSAFTKAFAGAAIRRLPVTIWLGSRKTAPEEASFHAALSASSHGKVDLSHMTLVLNFPGSHEWAHDFLFCIKRDADRMKAPFVSAPIIITAAGPEGGYTEGFLPAAWEAVADSGRAPRLRDFLNAKEFMGAWPDREPAIFIPMDTQKFLPILPDDIPPEYPVPHYLEISAREPEPLPAARIAPPAEMVPLDPREEDELAALTALLNENPGEDSNTSGGTTPEGPLGALMGALFLRDRRFRIKA